jgi:uncharacterized protein YihD (DUF1040 family)
MQNKIELFKSKAVENNLSCKDFLKWLTKELGQEINLNELSDEEMIEMNIKHEERYSGCDFDESYCIDFFEYYSPMFKVEEINILQF